MARSVTKGGTVIHRPATPQRIKAYPRGTHAAKLPVAAKSVIHAMVHGPYEDIVLKIDGPAPPKTIKAFEPMTFLDACRFLGLDPRHVLCFTRLRKFSDEMAQQLTSRRCLEQARNLGVAIQIRDSDVDGSPRSDETRLKAIMAIDRAYNDSMARLNVPQPQVQINNIQQNNTAVTTKPGYVINLAKPAPAIEHAE